MTQNNKAGHVNVQIEGDVSGQIAIGDNILQIGDVHGGVVNIIQPDKKPTFSQRKRPVMLRPRKFPGFLDRETEMGTIVGALNNGEPVSMHAENGTGKTSLLRQLAYHAPGDNFPDGILYFPTHIKNVDDLLQIIFDHFYESDSVAKPTEAELRISLQDIEALIILDDVLLDKDGVTELINAVPGSLFVLASPERCLWGEGRCIELEGLPLQEALTLIERELGRDLSSSEGSSAEALYQLGDGQPLFLLQAAALVRDGKPFDEILGALEESKDEAGKTLSENLNETQLSILDLLGRFKDAAIPRKHLTKLVEAKGIGTHLKKLKELRLVKEHGSAVSMAGALVLPLPLKQALGAGWEARGADYFIQWLGKNPPVSEIGEALDLILSLMERAVLTGRWEAVVSLSRGIERTLVLNKHWRAWAQVLDWTVKAAGSLSDQATQAWGLHQIGTRSLCLGDLSAAEESLKQALKIRETIGDQAGAAVTRGNLDLATTLPSPPPSQPGAAPVTGLSPLLKAALVLGGVAAATAAILLFRPPSQPPPEPPTAAPRAPVGEPEFVPVTGNTETPVTTETPVPTETPEPTTTTAITSTPAPVECTYDLKHHGTADLGPVVQFSFDPEFSHSDDDLKTNLTAFNNSVEVPVFNSFSFPDDDSKKVYIQLSEINLNDDVQIELLVDGVLHCSEIKSVYYDRYVTPTKTEPPPTAGPTCRNPSQYDYYPSACIAAGCKVYMSYYCTYP